jgi:hypothetical protein
MADSTYDTIKYRKGSIDDTMDAAEAGTQKPGPATANAPPSVPVRNTSAGPFGGKSNPDNQLPETAFHKVKTFFGIKD